MSLRLERQLHAPLPALRERRPDLRTALDDVIHRATAKDPAERYPDVAAMVVAWQQALTRSSVAATSAAAATERERQARARASAGAGGGASATGKAQRSAANRLRYLAGALAVFLVVAIGLAALAFNRQVAAVANLTHSERLRLAAEANNAIDRGESGDVPALLAIRSLQSGYTPQADAALLRALERGFIQQTFKGATGGAAFSSDGRLIVTANGNVASLWDAQTGQELRQFQGHAGDIWAVAFSPDAKYVLTGGAETTLRLWDTQTGQQLRVLVGHTDSVTWAAFSPDGQSILTGGYDRTARLWDTQTGQQLRVFTAHTSAVSSVAISLEGQQVYTVSYDRTTRVWRIDYLNAIQLACAQLYRDLTEEERKLYYITDDRPTCLQS